MCPRVALLWSAVALASWQGSSYINMPESILCTARELA